MAGERDLRRVARDAAGAFDDGGVAIGDGFLQFAGAMATVNAQAERVTGCDVLPGRRRTA
jgi:hypothetical protein